MSWQKEGEKNGKRFHFLQCTEEREEVRRISLRGIGKKKKKKQFVTTVSKYWHCLLAPKNRNGFESSLQKLGLQFNSSFNLQMCLEEKMYL